MDLDARTGTVLVVDRGETARRVAERRRAAGGRGAMWRSRRGTGLVPSSSRGDYDTGIVDRLVASRQP